MTGRRLFFGFPSFGGTFKAGTAMALMRVGQLLGGDGIPFETLVWAQSDVATARNALVAHFLTTRCTEIIMIDSDLVWGNEALAALLTPMVDFIAGAYRAKTDGEQRYFLKMLAQPTVEHGLLSVAAVPFGFVRLSRRCIEQMVAHYTDTYRTNGSDLTLPYLFNFEYRDGEVWGEDHGFCRKWREIGGKIYLIDPDIPFTHVGEKNYSGSLGDAMRKAAAASR